jgi:dienelactone hydrolase
MAVTGIPAIPSPRRVAMPLSRPTTLIAAFVALLIGGAAPAQQAPPKLPTEPELVGTMPYSTTNGPTQYLVVQVGDGGSGPYKSVLVGDPTLPTHTLYRPRDLKDFGANRKLPIVAHGNGACRNASYEVRNFLTEVASHGFLVVAIGPAIPTIAGGSYVSGPTRSSQLLDAVDWAVAENARPGSEFYGKVDTTKVAVMGHSCGGLQAMEVSTDPRVTTTILLNSGILGPRPPAQPAPPPADPNAAPAPPRGGTAPRPGMPAVTKDQLAKLHAPIAYFVGGKSDIAYNNAADDFAKIDSVPVVFANQDVGHYPATFLDPRGGAWGEGVSAWLKWQLQGDQTAARMFTGATCGLCRDPKWTIEKKKVP